MTPCALYKIFLFSFVTACALTLSNPATATQNTQTSSANADDGFYRELTVGSFKDCMALCKADALCRGASAEQADTSIPVMQCKLNNGFGANSPFPNIPPTPLNIDIALADFNAYRASKGLKALVLNDKLSAASLAHATDLAKHGIISHMGTDGLGHAERVKKQGYVFSIAAENVATGQKNWKSVFKAWQDSPGHNDNLLLDEVTEFGIALVYEPATSYQTYWAMLVATPFEANIYTLPPLQRHQTHP